MGKLIYGFNVSVDGYIADAHGSIDWSDPSDELHQYWNDFERETALSLYGRRLYELMSSYWPTADEAPDAEYGLLSVPCRNLMLLHELPLPSSDLTARQPHARGWLG